jgi:hypothetical protein
MKLEDYMGDDVAEIIPADELREITATEEQLHKTKVNALVTNFMDSMRRHAEHSGATSYSADILKSEEKVINDLKQLFEANGYKTLTNENSFQGKDVITLTLIWKED